MRDSYPEVKTPTHFLAVNQLCNQDIMAGHEENVLNVLSNNIK